MDYTPPKVWSPPPVAACVRSSEVPAYRTGTVSPNVVQVPLANIRQGYPVRGGWWTGCTSWTHLTVGVHTGKFPSWWLRSLTWSELQSLHSDDHEGRVKWSSIPKQ